MGDAHLYAVDSHGETTTPPSGPEGPTGGQEKRSRAASKARPRFAVATDRMKFPQGQVGALVAACVASRGGELPVTAEMQASFMDVAATTAGLNNAFFVDLGLLTKAGKGAYKPTDLALEFQRKWSFDKEAAPAVLRPAFEKSWFHDVVKQRLQVGPASVKQMIETLAGHAGTDDSYATQYRLLLNWLEFVGLIDTQDGNVALTTPAEPTAPDDVDEDVDVDTTTPTTADEKFPRSTAHQRPVAAPVIRMSVEMVVSQDDLARLTPEQIGALFEGAGKLAAVKAALEG